MTELNRPVRRRAGTAFAHYRKRIVVCLEPGDILAMRLESTRTTYRANVANVFRQLAHWHGIAEAQHKREARVVRQAGL